MVERPLEAGGGTEMDGWVKLGKHKKKVIG